ncbi:MAG TPA: hypothetical protein VJ487_04065 [Alphaproteobacteria bacterium]|nr:hypothetical protein [Alphaproteobacteria bacterium]
MVLVFAVGAVFLLGVWFLAILDWRRMVYGLLLLAPFTGIPILLSGHNSLALVLKDVLFVVPLYVSLFLLHPREVKSAHVPGLLSAALGFLAVLVLGQTLNPHVTVMLAALIGVKVWLFYLPLIYVMAAMIRRPADHIRLLRLMTVLAVIPCAIGLLQWFLALSFGYREAMQWFYGAAAKEATQWFSEFNYGGKFFRIPSTFSFVTQYYGFLLSMTVVSYIARRVDPSRKWRRFASLVFYTVIVASFLAGSRQAYLFTPATVIALYLLDGRLKGVMAAVVVVPVLVYGALDLGGMDPLRVLGVTGELTGTYGQEFIFDSPVRALEDVPFGMGPGADTGPARYAFPNQYLPAYSLRFNFESYYTKSIVELGFPGLLAVFGVFGTLIFIGLRARSVLKSAELRTAAAAYTAFVAVMAVNSIKGWSMDIDPINTYFWMFAGILCKLPYLESAEAARPQRAAAPLRGIAFRPRNASRPALVRRPMPGRLR